MNKLFKSFAVFLLLLPFSMSGYAADQNPEKGRKGMTMRKPMSDEQIDNKIRMKQEHMLKMHDLTNRILAESDPDKKEKLMREQRELMKAQWAKKREHHKQMMKKHRQMMKEE